MAQREPVARIEASLPMDGQECAIKRPSDHAGQAADSPSTTDFGRIDSDRGNNVPLIDITQEGSDA